MVLGITAQALPAHAIETAAAEYLAVRVAAVRGLPGNPYRAELRTHGKLLGFLVGKTSSPMMNRICGEARSAPDALADLVSWFEGRQCVPAVSLIVRKGRTAPVETIGSLHFRRLNGWTHLHLAAPVAELTVRQSTLEVEEVTADTIDSFAAIHAEAFRTEAERQPINRASFAGLIGNEHAKGFLVRLDGKPAAGAIVYFASNGVAYLGTSATRRAARGRGCHSALIGHRIMAARQHGSRFVAATAMPKSQSRRNLERLGLVASHLQALYRPQPGQQA
jgi:GNAT superfamily N-acetyltransferase